MKILIAGPIPSEGKSGGVAVFTENLAREALREKNQVMLVTRKHVKISNIDTASVWNINKIYNFKPDIIISSLQYSMFFILFKKTFKIHLLHGFPRFGNYSFLRLNLMHIIDCLINKKFDVELANSKFTKFINEQIYNLKVNGIFNIGLDNQQLKDIVDNPDIHHRKDLLYVGRVVKSKNIELAIDAFILAQKPDDVVFNIVGGGPDLKRLEQKYKKNKRIKFWGPVSHAKINEIYRKSKVFISLNPSEPFGITFEEAILNGLYILAPDTGGQIEFLNKFKGQYSKVDINDRRNIIDKIQVGLKSKYNFISKKEVLTHSYKSTLYEILKYYYEAK
ncbi:MAG TPA: glycosyltransferase family 4 protein [Candidatus Dwaynia gallinarum]|nr:glycosyltransferase family 4 protein [Candidatus Dwaynia gallinarum]